MLYFDKIFVSLFYSDKLLNWYLTDISVENDGHLNKFNYIFDEILRLWKILKLFDKFYFQPYLLYWFKRIYKKF